MLRPNYSGDNLKDFKEQTLWMSIWETLDVLNRLFPGMVKNKDIIPVLVSRCKTYEETTQIDFTEENINWDIILGVINVLVYDQTISPKQKKIIWDKLFSLISRKWPYEYTHKDRFHKLRVLIDKLDKNDDRIPLKPVRQDTSSDTASKVGDVLDN